jgi:hypothetical protein
VVRYLNCIAFAFAILAARAHADDAAPPTPAQLAAAKKAYADGKALHDKGNLPEAIEKFKESYRLSKNPLLLYNIGFTMDEAGQKDLALFYYRKFLADAPPTADQRPSVTERVKALEKEFNPGATQSATDTKTDAKTDTKTDAKTEPKPDKKFKPPGTYSATDFQHQIVEEAPPGKPLDLTSFVPEDSGFVVTAYFRVAGEATFTAKVMKWRYKELVARVPAAKMTGTSIQYYIEVKDTTGQVVTRSGKSTMPNLVTLEPTAQPRFYPDFTDDAAAPTAAAVRQSDDDDPLGPKKSVVQTEQPTAPVAPVGPQDGFMDVGSKKFMYVKWGATGTAAALVGLSVLFYVQAHNSASTLADDSKSCGAPPCRQFDSTDQDFESFGKSRSTLFGVSLGFGVAATAVAGYYWYKELTAKKRHELPVSGKAPAPTSWVVTPSFGDGLTGAAAVKAF